MRVLLRALALLLAFAVPAEAAYECYTVPNSSAAAFSAQARLFDQDLRILALAERRTGVVYSAGGCLVTAQGSPNMSVHVAACTVSVEGTTASVSAGDVTVTAANATNPRIDMITVNSAGTLGITAGTAAASPQPGTIPDSSAVLAFVYVPAGDTAINANQITDKRACLSAAGGGGGAATTEPFITKTATAGLSNEFALGSLATGLLINTTTTGVPTILAAQTCTNQFVRSYTASGTATCQTVSLSADVSGDLPYANLTQATAASRLLGRGDSGAGDWQEVTLGAGLNMTGTVISSTPVGGGGDFSSNTSTSVDSEVVLFSGTNGKTGKRATGTGIARLASGVQSAAELSGDVTTSGSNAATIANNAVTTAKVLDANITKAKIENVAADKLLGRGNGGGAGAPQEITLGTNLSLTGTTLNASGGGGGPTVVYLAGDVAMPSTSASYSDVTGFSFTPAANKDYLIEFTIIYTGDTAAIGADFAVNGPASPTSITCLQINFNTATVSNQSLIAAYDTNGNKSTATLTGQNMIATMNCLFRNGSTSSAFILRHRLETGTSGVNTVKAGSVLRYTLLN